MMSDCNWEIIDAFRSPGEYGRFLKWIEEQVDAGFCEEFCELDANGRPGDSRIFRCKATGETWRLSPPDPGYSYGSWLPVHQSD